MNVSTLAGGTMLSQAVSLLHTQTSMLKMSAEADQAVAGLLQSSGGQAQNPSQAVTPAAGSGKGTQVDITA
ncbi:hypothetical protein F1188_18210 [Roseospira marina]|uniref:Motility protein n=1 Tax=Roseospira marina TaxID=140057 RepID=A0A5M6I8B2_9PROT|nr:hypothetical protein [Roseospira marina]KAA5603958.1 hypothetical protein F1188_18210 [Roseospira marina]MBB4315926.1 hypothetical protein [Roseospira marina]MBB5089112.1 hypothetical protein [Roseospira marina]